MVHTSAASAAQLPRLTSNMETPQHPRDGAWSPVVSEVLSWGANDTFQLGNGEVAGREVPGPVLLPKPATLQQVAAGYSFGLVLTTTGLVWGWGANTYGQLGNNSTDWSDRAVPVQMSLPEGDTVTAVAAGAAHGIALTSGGDVYTWGDNHYGQLGIGDTSVDKKLVPVQVTIPWTQLGLPENTTITAVAAGAAHCLALTSTNQVLAWGYNSKGQLGNNDPGLANQFAPVLVDLPEQVTVSGIAAGREHSLTITTTNTALAWGSNLRGQLGNPQVGDHSFIPVPVQLPANTTITAITAGLYHSLAHATNGGVLGWGDNQSGQLGDPTAADHSATPVPASLPAEVTVTDIAAGGMHSLARTTDGSVLGWGDNQAGQVGDGTTEPDRALPVWVTLPPGVHAHSLSAGSYFSVALVTPGPKLAWGANDMGQLGDNENLPSGQTPADQHTPVQIGAEDMVFTDLTAGEFHSLAITETGHILAWGSNKFGQLGLGSDPLGVGPEHSSYIDKPMEVLLDQDIIPQAIAAGAAHSLALSTDGALYVFGRNNYGQLGLGDNASHGDYPMPVEQPLDWLPPGARIIGIAAAYLHSLVLLDTGQVYAFGFNYYGQLGTGDTRPCYTPAPMHLPDGISITGIAAGSSYSLILATDGTAYGCGYNYYGQLGTGDNTQLLEPDKAKPVVVPEGVTGITTITAGASHSLAITTDGKALAFGANTNGQLGYGQPGTNTNTAGYVDTSALNLPTDTTITTMTGGAAHSLAVTSGGLILAWGNNTRGQLGNNYPHQANRPQPVSQSLGTNGSAVAAGAYHSLAR